LAKVFSSKLLAISLASIFIITFGIYAIDSAEAGGPSATVDLDLDIYPLADGSEIAEITVTDEFESIHVDVFICTDCGKGGNAIEVSLDETIPESSGVFTGEVVLCTAGGCTSESVPYAFEVADGDTFTAEYCQESCISDSADIDAVAPTVLTDFEGEITGIIDANTAQLLD